MSTAFYLVSNFFHIYAVYVFSNSFYNKKSINKGFEAILYLIYYSINSAAFLVFDNWLITLLSNLLPFFAITFIYKSSLLKKITSTVIIYIVAMTCDILVATFMTVFKIHSLFFEMGLVSNVVFLAAVNLITHCFSKRKDYINDLPAAYYITVVIVPVGSIIVGYYVAVGLNTVALISSIILLLINTDVFYLYDKLIDIFYIKQQQEMIEKQNLAFQNQLDIMRQSQLKIRCLKHDMDNHIINMSDLLSKGEYSKLKEYLNKTKDFTDMDDKIIESGNENIDSILNYKLQNIQKLNVETDYDVVVPGKMTIDQFDLSIVVDNLLDNAIEALGALPYDENKQLTISIRRMNGYLKMLFGNTFDGIITENNKTKKNDNINHGLGLKSVQMIVDKYSGIIKTNKQNKWYEVSVILYEQ